MKCNNYFERILLIPTLIFLATFIYGQESHITKIDPVKVDAKKACLVLINIEGSITIEESNDNSFSGEIKRTEKIGTDGSSKDMAPLIQELREDTLFLYADYPCHNEPRPSQHGWTLRWEEGCRQNYTLPRYDYSVRVPKGTDINVNTINDGDILIKSASGPVHANNINGSITLNNLSGPSTWVSTINGDVEVAYLKNPTLPCRYYTLNGDINTFFQPDLNASSTFKSFQGDFFTDVDDITTRPRKIEKRKANKDGLKLEVGGSVIQFNDGSDDLMLEFETFNGNAYLKTKSK